MLREPTLIRSRPVSQPPTTSRAIRRRTTARQPTRSATASTPWTTMSTRAPSRLEPISHSSSMTRPTNCLRRPARLPSPTARRLRHHAAPSRPFHRVLHGLPAPSVSAALVAPTLATRSARLVHPSSFRLRPRHSRPAAPLLSTTRPPTRWAQAPRKEPQQARRSQEKISAATR